MTYIGTIAKNKIIMLTKFSSTSKDAFSPLSSPEKKDPSFQSSPLL